MEIAQGHAFPCVFAAQIRYQLALEDNKPRWMLTPLLAVVTFNVNCAAQAVLLLVNSKPFGTSQAATIMCAVESHFAVYSVLSAFQVAGFACVELSVADACGDAVLLGFETLIDLREAGGGQYAGEHQCQDYAFHFVSLRLSHHSTGASARC